jgi:hypothetical protein
MIYDNFFLNSLKTIQKKLPDILVVALCLKDKPSTY